MPYYRGEQMDSTEKQENELKRVMQKITEYSQRAALRREAYMNSNFADMPVWDRMMVEMVIDTHNQMDALRQEVAELKEIFTPAPETFKE